MIHARLTRLAAAGALVVFAALTRPASLAAQTRLQIPPPLPCVVRGDGSRSSRPTRANGAAAAPADAATPLLLVERPPGARATAAPDVERDLLAALYTVRTYERGLAPPAPGGGVAIPPMAPARAARAYAELAAWEWDLPAGAPPRAQLVSKGLAAAQQAVAAQPSSVVALVARGTLASVRAAGADVSGLDDLQRAVSLDPQDADAQHFYGLALLRTGDVSRAEGALRRARQLGGNRAATLFKLAELDAYARRFGDACRRLNELVDDEPYAYYGYGLRALVRIRFGDIRNAWADAEIATRTGRPFWGNAVTAVVDAAARDTLSARTKARRLLASLPKAPARLDAREGVFVARALVAGGDTQRAFETLARTGPCGPELALMLRAVEFDPVRRDARFGWCAAP